MDRLQYLDFELRISGQAKKYTAYVVHSPAGEAITQFSIPLSQDRLDLLVLQLSRIRSAIRGQDTVELSAARELGDTLFKAVFQGGVRDVLRSSLDKVRQQPDTALCLKLRLQDAPYLADLPWEYLYDADLSRFLALSLNTTLVRYIELPESIPPLRAALPLNILGMIAAPSDCTPLDVNREQALVRQAFEPLVEKGYVKFTWLEKATLPALRHALQGGQYHILHFIGHGGFDKSTEQGVLLFEDDQGRSNRVGAERLGVLLHDHRSLRMAILNACEGGRSTRSDPFAGVAATLAQQGLPAVVAMQFSISDPAAISFASEFYSALARGFPVNAAVAEARKAIFTEVSDVEWGTPVLFLRAADGVLFEIEEAGQVGIPKGIAATQVFINTGGGPYIEGDVSTGGGDIIGQDQLKMEGGKAHEPSQEKRVEPLPMPAPDQRVVKNKRWLFGIGGILGAILLLWGGFILLSSPSSWIRGLFPISSATPTAEEARISKSTEAPTPIIPTNTPVIQPTETPTHFIPTNTPVIQSTNTAISLPESLQADVLFAETFDDNQKGWTEQSQLEENAPHIVSRVIDGEYKHVISCPSYYSAKFCGFYIPVPYAHAQNFHFEIDTRVRMEGSSASVAIEIWFRRHGENRYSIGFYDEGFYNIILAQEGRNPVLIAEATDTLEMNRNKKGTVTNQLGIDVKENVFKPFVNGQYYGPETDPNRTFMDDGEFLIAIHVSPEGSAWIDFDNLMITTTQQ